MSGEDVAVADELEAIRQLKARYCRFLDTKDVDSWHGVMGGRIKSLHLSRTLLKVTGGS